MKDKIDESKLLGTMPIGKLIFKMGLPAVLAQVINMLYNLVDRIYIGHIPDVGALALTGMGICLPIILLISAFASLVAMGAAPRASVFMGKQDNKTAENIMGNSFVLLILVSIVITAVILIFKAPILGAFGASEDTMPFANSYLTIYAIGTIFVQLTLGMNAFITAQGFSTKSMLTILIGAILNIILDPIFIFGFKMGVQGAALATVISQAASCIWVLVFLFGKKSILKMKAKNMKLSPKIFLPCLALGMSPFIMQSTESLIMVCFNSSLKKYGGDLAVGAMTIFMSVMQFAMLPIQGLGQGAQPIAGYNYGARNVERLKETFKKLLIISLIYTTTLWLLVEIVPQMFAMMFTNDEELIAYTATNLRIFLACIFLMGIQNACQMVLIGIDKPIASVCVAMLRKIVLIVPLIYILPLMMEDKVLAVILAEPISDFIAVSCTCVIFAYQFKKTLKKLRNENELAAKLKENEVVLATTEGTSTNIKTTTNSEDSKDTTNIKE